MSAKFPRLLIIDHQPPAVDPLVRFLAARSLDVQVAFDGADGLRKAVAHAPELILLDLVMPEMDGHEVCQRLKADARTAEVPVIFLSASLAVEDKLKSFALGAADYIVKPYSVEEVEARIFVQLRHKWHIERLRAMIGRRAIEGAGDKAFPDEHIFSRALAELDKRMSNPPALIELASKLGTNERKLTEIFRQRVQMTVFDYFSDLRLQTARHLLEGSGMKVQSIASHVGYRNAGDFTRAFRRRYELSPREYRQAHGGKASSAG